MRRKQKRIGRPILPDKDRLRLQIRIDVEDATNQAVQREMKKTGESRSKVIRSLVREALRARGHKLLESHEERRDREKES